MAQPSFKSRLVGRTPRVADIVSFEFEKPEGYEYQAGQWFVVTFPGPSEPHSHHFSHSNSPLDPVLEFTTRMRGTTFKNALGALPLGAEVELEGPFGSFTMSEDLKPVAFIAGGIGITCVRSLLRRLAAEEDRAGRESRTVALLFANHSEDSIPFREELELLGAAIHGMKTIHVLSRPSDAWAGYRGHIDREVFERELIDPAKWTYFVSGPPAFGQSMREELVAWKVIPASIKMENFEGY